MDREAHTRMQVRSTGRRSERLGAGFASRMAVLVEYGQSERYMFSKSRS